MSAQSAAPEKAVRRTPLHAIHAAAEAVWTTGEDGWELAAGFGDEQGELDAARNGLAIHDASHGTLLEVAGRGAAAFLAQELSPDAAEQPYDRAIEATEGSGNEKVTVFHLAPERYMLSASSGLRDALRERLRSAAAESPNVHVADQTSGFACFHLLGPRARQVLRKVTQLNLNDEVFAAGSFAQGSVAHTATWVHGVPEGLNLYVSWNLAAHLWEVLLDAGGEFGIQPIGTRARGRLDTT